MSDLDRSIVIGGPNARATLEAVRKEKALQQKRRKPFDRRLARQEDIERLIKHRYGGPIPEHDDLRNPYIYLVTHAVCCRFKNFDDRLPYLRDWGLKWAPWLGTDGMAFYPLVCAFKPGHRDIKDQTAGQKLNVKLEERRAIRCHTLRPCDLSSDEWEAERKKRKNKADRDRASKKRRENGSKSQAEISANSINKAQPWIDMGISKSTYYRRQKADKALLTQKHSLGFNEPETSASHGVRDANETSASRLIRDPITISIDKDSWISSELVVSQDTHNDRSGAAKRPPANRGAV